MIRFIVTVSPVPLDVTFTGSSPRVSSVRAKSMLRAAAQSFADAYASVDYLPAYEMVTLSERRTAFIEDCRHPSDQIVQAVTDLFVRAYIAEDLPDPPNFNENDYLTLHPDVETAVRERPPRKRLRTLAELSGSDIMSVQSSSTKIGQADDVGKARGCRTLLTERNVFSRTGGQKKSL